MVYDVHNLHDSDTHTPSPIVFPNMGISRVTDTSLGGMPSSDWGNSLAVVQVSSLKGLVSLLRRDFIKRKKLIPLPRTSKQGLE